MKDGYKVVENTPHRMVLQHPEGHQVTIAKAALKKETLAGLTKYAQGGEVNYGASKDNNLDQSKTDAFKQGMNGGAQQQQPAPQPKPTKVAKLADGGMAKPEDPTFGLSPDDQPQNVYSPQSQVSRVPPVAPPDPTTPAPQPYEEPSGWDYIKGAGKYLGHKAMEGVHALDSTPIGHALLTNDTSQLAKLKDESQGHAPTQQPNVTMPTNFVPGTSQGGMRNAADEQPGQPGQGVPGMDGLIPQQQAYQNEMGAIRRQANAEGSLGQLQANTYNNEAAKMDDLEYEFNQQHQKYMGEAQHVLEDMDNNHINPNHYMESKSVPGRISQAIGLILGGAGAGLTHSDNPAEKFLNSQIDRDIAAQQQNINNKHTVFAGYRQLLGDNGDALKMTTATQQLKYAALIKANAGVYANPLAQAKADQMVAQLQRQAFVTMAQMSAKRTLYGISAQGKKLSPEIINSVLPYMDQKDASDIRDRYVPNAQALANSKEDAAILKKQDTNSSELIKVLGELKQISDTAGVGGTWAPAAVAKANFLAGRAQDLYRQTQGEGVFRKGESEFIQSIVPGNPTGLLSGVLKSPKLAQGINDMEAARRNLYQTYGLHVSPVLAYQPPKNTNVPGHFKQIGFKQNASPNQ